MIRAEVRISCYVKIGLAARFLQLGGEIMPNANLEITQKAMEDFKKIQEYMLLAREENSVKTFEKLKDEYLYLKSFLNVAGVNLTDLDKFKE